MISETRITENKTHCLVIIPAYNEQACIDRVVHNVRQHGFHRIAVINDGSTDATTEVAGRAGATVLALPFNLGIGGAVQTGLKFALDEGYSYVIRLDGDGQHQVQEATKLLRTVQEDKADVAIGSRFCPGEQTYTPPASRLLGIRWFAAMITFLTGGTVYDPTSGMYALNRRALQALAPDFPQDYPEVEGRILMHKANLRVIEIPVVMQPRTAGVSSITPVRSIYYALKVTLATFIMALRKPSPRVAGGN